MLDTRTFTKMQILRFFLHFLQILIVFAIFGTIAYWSYKACYIFEWRYKNITVPMFNIISYTNGWLNQIERFLMDPNIFTSTMTAFRLSQDWTIALAFICALYPIFYTFK